jgi:hypothetical protein
VPRIQEEERHEEVEDVGGEERDDEREEELVLEELVDGKVFELDLRLDGFDRDEDGGEDQVPVVSLSAGSFYRY